MRFAELSNNTQVSESSELNSVTQRYINSHIKEKLYSYDRSRPYRLLNVLEFLRKLKDSWRQSGDPSTFEIADVLEPYKRDIIDYLKGLFVGSSDSYLPLYQAALLFNAGVHWPDVVEIFEPHKESIIKRILMQIKYGYNKSDVISWLTALRAIGIDWPELNAIEKSFNSDKSIQENEVAPVLSMHDEYMLKQIAIDNFAILPSYLCTHRYKSVIVNALNDKKHSILEFVKNEAKLNRWMYVAKTVYGLKNQGLQWPELDTLLDNSKTPCIIYLLTTLKNMEYEKDDLEHLINIINVLKKSGADWSELQIIKDTAETELDKIPPDEEEEEYEPDDDYHGYRFNY